MWDTLVASPPGVPKWDDSVAVRNLFLTNEGGKTRYVPTNKSIEEWDCTALFEATIFAKTFAKPSTLHTLYVKPRGLSAGTFHHSVISPAGNQAETYALALDQLRLLRNMVCHQISTREINKATFDRYVQLAKDAFAALKQDTTGIDEIGRLAEKDFPTERQQELEAELKTEKDNAIKYEQIEEHLTNIELQVESVRSDVKDVETKVENVGTEIMKGLQAGFAEIKQTVQVENSKGASAQYAEPAPMDLTLNSTAPAGPSDEIKRKRSPASPKSTHDPKRLKAKKVKDGSPTDDEFRELSRKIPVEWMMLARKLGIDEDMIRILDRQNRDYHEKAYQMFVYRQRDIGELTYKVLNDGLIHVSRRDLAEKFCQTSA
ncbi:hypothetical protein ACROYT_G019577 [Oculina patagonica]